MTGPDVWNIVRLVIGLYLIGLGIYAISTRRMPRIRRPRWSYPFPAGTDYRGRHAVLLGFLCIAVGLLVMLARMH
jgi:hypothetical protein